MPVFVRALGRGLREFRRSVRDIRSAVGIDQLLEDEDEIYRTRAPLDPPKDIVSRDATDDGTPGGSKTDSDGKGLSNDPAPALAAGTATGTELPLVDASVDAPTAPEVRDASEARDKI